MTTALAGRPPFRLPQITETEIQFSSGPYKRSLLSRFKRRWWLDMASMQSSSLRVHLYSHEYGFTEFPMPMEQTTTWIRLFEPIYCHMDELEDCFSEFRDKVVKFNRSISLLVQKRAGPKVL